MDRLGRRKLYPARSARSKALQYGLIRSIQLFVTAKREAGNAIIAREIVQNTIQPDSIADLTVSIHHHSEGWLEPAFKRSFRKVIESSSDIVFTGHEHEQDYHLTKNQLGRHFVYVEADSLQDVENSKRSGFNAIVLDMTSKIQQYFLFRWKSDRYTAKVDGDECPLVLSPKTTGRFTLSDKYEKYLSLEDFGFTHPQKQELRLEDIFVFPSVTILDPSSSKTTKSVEKHYLSMFLRSATFS